MMLRVIGQALLFAAFAGFIGWFSAHPVYVHHDPELALIKLSFSHAGERKEECRTLTPEEIAALPPNMRRPMECGRERVPVRVELLLDGVMLVGEALKPMGLARDGASTVYRRIRAAPGVHELTLRLRDNRRLEGFDYEWTETVTLEAGRVLAIDFRAQEGGFLIL